MQYGYAEFAVMLEISNNIIPKKAFHIHIQLEQYKKILFPCVYYIVYEYIDILLSIILHVQCRCLLRYV